MTELEITRPDDWHAHLRDGAVLGQTTADMARYFGRVIVMPNLSPPVRTTADAVGYRGRIMASMAGLERRFEPLMVLYLTDQTTVTDIQEAAASPYVHAVKLYPAGATTNSASGVTDLGALAPVLEAMENVGLPLLVHGEVTDDGVDIFDREKVFIETILDPLTRQFEGLGVVLEHITTADAVEFVYGARDKVAATITAHHLLYNRNDMLVGGIRPHFFCLPILKRNVHQQALLEAATSGSSRFFLGTDSAPHAQQSKETACGCAGCYTANAALEMYATAFAAMDRLEQLEGFASHHGADFYGLPRNTDTVVLRETPHTIPLSLPFGDTELIPLAAGETLQWSVVTGPDT